jgi:hypothetical protein
MSENSAKNSERGRDELSDDVLAEVYQDFAMSKYASPAERVAALAREVARLRAAAAQG